MELYWDATAIHYELDIMLEEARKHERENTMVDKNSNPKNAPVESDKINSKQDAVNNGILPHP